MHSLPLIMILTVALATGGCSHFSKSSRQQRAYEKYVRKSSMARQKQRELFRPTTPQIPPPQEVSEPVETIESGPESITSENSRE